MKITVELDEEDRAKHDINLAWVSRIEKQVAEQLEAEAEDLLYEIVEEYS